MLLAVPANHVRSVSPLDEEIGRLAQYGTGEEVAIRLPAGPRGDLLVSQGVEHRHGGVRVDHVEVIRVVVTRRTLQGHVHRGVEQVRGQP